MPINGPHSASVVLDGLEKTQRFLANRKKRSKKSQDTSMKIEAFRLKNKLQKDLRQGTPGGKRFAPLSYIARRLNSQTQIMGGVTRRQNPNRAPLARLAQGVRYAVKRGKNFAVEVGFIQPGQGSHKVSKSLRDLAAIHQAGFMRNITQRQREYILYRGGTLGKIAGGATPFFLRKSTRQFRTPARKIITPFWSAEKRNAMKNIRNNYRKKMKGQRI